MQPQVQTAKVAGARGGGHGDGGDDPGKNPEDIMRMLQQMLLRGSSWRQAKSDIRFVVLDEAAPPPAEDPPAALEAAPPPAADDPPGVQPPQMEPPHMEPPPGNHHAPAPAADPAEPPPEPAADPAEEPAPDVIILDGETDEWTGRHTDVHVYVVFLLLL